MTQMREKVLHSLANIPVANQPEELDESHCDHIAWKEPPAAEHVRVSIEPKHLEKSDWMYPTLDVEDNVSERKFECFSGSSPSPELMGKTLTVQRKSDAIHQQMGLVTELANRAFSLGSMLELVCILLDKESAFSEIKDLEAAYVYHSGISADQWPDLSFFNAESTQTWEVTYRCFVPLSRQRQCAFGKILTGHAPCLAQRMVSHTWNNVFLDTVASCVAAAQGKGYFFHIRPRLRSVKNVKNLMCDLGTEALNLTFWCCALSINQHTVACHESPWPCPCDMQKITEGYGSEVGAFDLMMRLLSQNQEDFAQVVAVDEESLLQVDVARIDNQGKQPEYGFGSSDSLESTRDSTVKFGGSQLTLKSFAPSMSRTEKYSWCGLVINWKYRCVVQVDLSAGVAFSRQIVVGDIIESVNGMSDIDIMIELIRSSHSNNLSLQLRRTMSVTTRIWVVAEIAEAQRWKVPQLVVPHFPMTLSGPEHRLRILAVDVMASEASKEADREMILARIERNADEYNTRLRQALLATPSSWWIWALGLVVCGIIVFNTMRMAQSLLNDELEEACGTVSYLLGLLLAFWCVRFLARYWWILDELHNANLPPSLRTEIYFEATKYFQLSRNPSWTWPFLAIGLLLKPSLKQRSAAILITATSVSGFNTLRILLLAHSWDCGSEGSANSFCQRGAWWLVVFSALRILAFILLWFALTEQKLALAGRGPATILPLCIPHLVCGALEAVYVLGSLQSLVFVVVSNCAVVLFGFEAYSKYLGRILRRIRSMFS